MIATEKTLLTDSDPRGVRRMGIYGTTTPEIPIAKANRQIVTFSTH